jgi:hypothetical protein
MEGRDAASEVQKGIGDFFVILAAANVAQQKRPDKQGLPFHQSRPTLAIGDDPVAPGALGAACAECG